MTEGATIIFESAAGEVWLQGKTAAGDQWQPRQVKRRPWQTAQLGALQAQLQMELMGERGGVEGLRQQDGQGGELQSVESQF